MSLVSMICNRRRGILSDTGTQTVTGTLTFSQVTNVYLDPSLFTTAGTYTLFTYGTLKPNTGSGTSFPTAQDLLNARLRINTSYLTGLVASDIYGTINTTLKKITVTLVPSP